jgi:hypothetical protein
MNVTRLGWPDEQLNKNKGNGPDRVTFYGISIRQSESVRAVPKQRWEHSIQS